MSALSLRLETIASLVPRGARVCDVGTDHARLPIHLIKNGIATTVIATDLNKKPLENAQKNLEASNVSGIMLRHCDGLSGVAKNEADTIIVAGIGGEVISGILDRCDWLKSKDITLILQPTTSPETLRRFLSQNGFEILSETPVFENQKVYSVIKANFCGLVSDHPEHYYYIGRVPRTPDGIIYIKKQQKRVMDCMKAYQNIQSKAEDFRIYHTIYTAIENYLTENT